MDPIEGNEFYMLYKHTGLPTTMIILIAIRTFLASAGMIFSGILVLVTYKTKSLNSTCNILIAMNALSNFLYNSGFLVTPYLQISGKRFILARQCVFLQIFSAFGAAMVAAFLFFIAFDRLMCICMPIRYYKLNTKLYLSTVVLLVTTYGAYVFYLCFIMAMKISERQVLCSMVDCLAPEAPVFTLIWLLSTCVLYAIISFILKTSANKADKSTKRIFKSLLAIFIACFVPWFSTAIALYITGSMALSLINQWYIRVVFNYGVIFASIADAPILFWFSSEHNKAFRNFFKKIAYVPRKRNNQVCFMQAHLI